MARFSCNPFRPQPGLFMSKRARRLGRVEVEAAHFRSMSEWLFFRNHRDAYRCWGVSLGYITLALILHRK